MDIATVIGLVVAVTMMITSVILGGGKLIVFFEPTSAMVVLGGMLAATLVSFPLRRVAKMFHISRKVFHWDLEPAPQVIRLMVSLAETARREGLLALDRRLHEIEDPFIVLGVQMAVDGTRPEVTESILRDELDALATRHQEGKALFETMGRYAPAFGMIGTLLGLIIMLRDMTDPSTIGTGMAVALLTTLYGAVVANVCLLPFAEKLGYISRQELVTMEIVVRGVLAIQAGENPRIIEQKLQVFVSPEERLADEEAA